MVKGSVEWMGHSGITESAVYIPYSGAGLYAEPPSLSLMSFYQQASYLPELIRDYGKWIGQDSSAYLRDKPNPV